MTLPFAATPTYETSLTYIPAETYNIEICTNLYAIHRTYATNICNKLWHVHQLMALAFATTYVTHIIANIFVTDIFYNRHIL